MAAVFVSRGTAATCPCLALHSLAKLLWVRNTLLIFDPAAADAQCHSIFGPEAPSQLTIYLVIETFPCNIAPRSLFCLLILANRSRLKRPIPTDEMRIVPAIIPKNSTV